MFKIGDRVEGVTNDSDNGSQGTVTELFFDGYAVLLDKHVHEDGSGLASWFGFSEVKKVEK